MTLKQVAENHGLTPDGVDYALRQYQIILCEITGGILSKLSYDARDVLTYAHDRWCEKCDLKAQEAVEPTKVKMGNRTDYFCKNCATKVGMLFSNEDVWRFHYNSCPYCGRKVKWE